MLIQMNWKTIIELNCSNVSSDNLYEETINFSFSFVAVILKKSEF